jgi:hypothetical protein
MAKKKSKKRRPPPRRPASAPAKATERTEGDEHQPSKRAERKEEARRERERRIKAARRRQRNRKLARWGIAAAVVGGVGVFVAMQVVQGRKVQQEAAVAAERVGCTPVQLQQDEVDAAAALDSQTLHSPPFDQGENGIPITAGRHASPIDGGVYRQPVDESNTTHNLEHGYVVVSYAGEGENALDQNFVDALEDYTQSQEKILMAPYEGLANEVDFLAWGNLQTCDPPEGAETDDLIAVLQAFVDEFRSGGLAPEPNGA